MAEHHTLMGGKLHIYKRENSQHWQVSTYLAGKNWRKSTKEESLSHAKDIAEDWYLELRGKSRAGALKTGKTFREAAKHFLAEYLILVAPERNPHYMRDCEMRLKAHLLPFFGDKVLAEITPGLVQQYRVHRMTARRPRPIKRELKPGEAIPLYPVPSRSTLHQEIVALRQVLKAANRQGWLEFVPDLSPPYKASGKITHRAWFSPEEYQQLYEATRRRAQKPLNNRHRWACEQMHDYVLFMANTGLRPDEAARLEFRDIKIVKDPGSKETILEIEVRGKRGVGWCKSTTRAVLPFERLRDRERLESGAEDRNPADAARPPSVEAKKEARKVKPGPTEKIFPSSQRELFNALLRELNLKHDRDGNLRTTYSLRHTYICFRLMEGADIYQIAKNCRTSVEMIEKYYAAHIKTMLDAAAINVNKGVIRQERKSRAGGHEDTIRTDRQDREGSGEKTLRRKRRTREGGPKYPLRRQRKTRADAKAEA
jgi:integrase